MAKPTDKMLIALGESMCEEGRHHWHRLADEVAADDTYPAQCCRCGLADNPHKDDQTIVSEGQHWGD